MDVVIIVLLALCIVFLLGGVYLAYVSTARSGAVATRARASEETEEDVKARVVAPRAVRVGRGGTGRMRQRRGRTGPAVETAEGEEEEEVEEREEEGEEGGEGGSGGKGGGKKKGKKEKKKKEKEERKEIEEEARGAKSEKFDQYADRQKQKEEEREGAERQKAAEMAEFESRREAESAAELDSWKGMFSVEGGGSIEEEIEEQSQGLLQGFVDYIKDVVNRVIALEQMGRISGVMDDRGKFIFISPQEMKAVAHYIVRTGRVSIAGLAAKSNEFIDLEPKVVEESGIENLEPWAVGGGGGEEGGRAVEVA